MPLGLIVPAVPLALVVAALPHRAHALVAPYCQHHSRSLSAPVPTLARQEFR